MFAKNPNNLSTCPHHLLNTNTIQNQEHQKGSTQNPYTSTSLCLLKNMRKEKKFYTYPSNGDLPYSSHFLCRQLQVHNEMHENLNRSFSLILPRNSYLVFRPSHSLFFSILTCSTTQCRFFTKVALSGFQPYWAFSLFQWRTCTNSSIMKINYNAYTKLNVYNK